MTLESHETLALWICHGGLPAGALVLGKKIGVIIRAFLAAIPLRLCQKAIPCWLVLRLVCDAKNFLSFVAQVLLSATKAEQPPIAVRAQSQHE